MLSRALATPEPTGLRARYAEKRARLHDCLPAPGRPGAGDIGAELMRRNAAIGDELILEIAEGASARADEVAVAAVGAYGRGLLALASDLDVRILVDDVSRAEGVVDALLYPLWDAGVAVGHQVVRADDLLEQAKTDLPTATSLLDWRHLVGRAALSEDLLQRAAAGVFAPGELGRFMERLQEEVTERHQRFGGSVYLLEPDVKNGAGGLRDLDVARWAAKARFGTGDEGALVRLGVLVPREARELTEAGELLYRMRNLLHAHAGRRSDRLTFDEQELLAELLEYGKGGEAVEQMMSAYYRAARAISRGRDMILARATPVLRRRPPKVEDLGDGIATFDGAVTLSDAARLRDEPELALGLVAAAVDLGVPLLPYARDAISRIAADPAFCEALRASPRAASLFVGLISTVKETALHRVTAPRELHDLGLLLAMIPEFSPVVGRVHHDVYHVYTVDVHSVAAVDRLAALIRGDLAEEYPLASQLAAEISRPAMLFFATLLHDVGKAIGGRDHSQRGAEMCSSILGRLGFDEDAIADAQHLILKHLAMYHVATRRDLDDPETAAEFAREVRDREGLRNLYLLTVADISTTSPTSMTSWKARMLDELYVATDRALAGAPPDDRRLGKARSEVMEAVELLPARDGDERDARRSFAEVYLRGMPERYVLANAPAAIASHAEVARRHGGAAVSLALTPSRHPVAAELCVVAPDRPGLLSRIAAALAASRLEVMAAQVNSRTLEDGTLQAVDLFWVRDRTEGVEGVAQALPKLRRDLSAILSGAVDPQAIVSKIARGRRDPRGPKVPTRVTIENRASPRHTVIEVTTIDRPGVLFIVADALFRLGLSIALAKISTEGSKVADVFYVNEGDGAKIPAGPRIGEIARAVTAALDGQPNEESLP